MPEPNAKDLPPLDPIPESTWETIRRSLGKLALPFIPHRSGLGRMMRTRVCKRPPLENSIATEIARTRHQIFDFAPDSEVLTLGSSHTQCDILPQPGDALRLWNVGIVNGDLYQAWCFYSALRDRWPRRQGQIVLLSEDFWAPASQSEYTFFYWLAAVLHLIAGLPMRSTFALGPIRRRIHALSHITRPQQAFRGRLRNDDRFGTSQDAAKAVRSHLNLLRFPASELLWQERLRAAVEADGRRLVLFRPPLRADYRAELAKQAAGRDVYAPGAKAREGLPILDYTETPIPEDGWYDADHLNDCGAARFTPTLITDLQTLLAPH